MKAVRCAIYTRKSSEEGLEQAFNSLDAQRESCAAYILSQASEGWTALPDIYDDGGLSGGTLERPALQRLLAEVAAGRIDIIVVYKVDRLTRSLLDFSKLVEAFDKAGTSFVSVTQSFNTTTSMGRLTLNMLLSFAQFEREVTAERIRDKIAASKAKGMWMGGVPPLGYEPDGRSLKVVEPHAAIVRDIFQRYLKLDNVRLVADGLERDGVMAPQRHTASGKPIGGGALSRGQIYMLLKNEMYIGIIAHNGQRYPALHQPIIDPDTWKLARAKIADNLQGHRAGARAKNPSLLAGKVVDANGQPLVAVHANGVGKLGVGPVRYRYYVSRALQDGTGQGGFRVPARELEGVAVERLAKAFDDPIVLTALAEIELHADDVRRVDELGREQAALLRARHRETVHAVLSRVRVENEQITIACQTAAIASALGLKVSEDAPAQIDLVASVRLTRSGHMLRLIDGNGAQGDHQSNRALVRLLSQAQEWWAELRQGELNVTELAARDGVLGSYITRVVRLAFLSPEIVTAIVDAKQPAQLSASKLIHHRKLPAEWSKQSEQLIAAYKIAQPQSMH